MKRLDAGRRRWVTALRFIAVASVCIASVVRADSSASAEYKVKAASLFNFAKFVEWPAASFETSSSPIEIGVLGDNPFGSVLEDVVRDQTVHARPVVVRPATRNLADLKSCHVIFVSRSEKIRLKEVLVGLKGSHALTVGDLDDFAARGGMIQFVLEKGMTRFQINNAAAKREELKISSQLLDLGKPVEEKEPK